MELSTRIVRFRSFWMYPLIAAGLVGATAADDPGRDLSQLVWLTPVGLVVWTLLEYGLHRFAFHVDVRLLNESHLKHHRDPRNPDHLFVQTLYGLSVSAALFAFLFLITGNLFQSAGIISGIWTGFLYYEYVHYSVHLNVAGPGVVSYQRKAHFHHHFTDTNRCFGVTSPLWDHVFGTALPGRPA